jgi:hypothetical protein
MPLLSETGETLVEGEPERRASPRAGRLGCAVLLALLLFTPFAPFFVPVIAHSGDRWLFIEGAWLSPQEQANGETGVAWLDLSQRVTVRSVQDPPSSGRWRTTGDYHQRALQVGAFYYSIEWFRGRSLR